MPLPLPSPYFTPPPLRYPFPPFPPSRSTLPLATTLSYRSPLLRFYAPLIFLRCQCPILTPWCHAPAFPITVPLMIPVWSSRHVHLVPPRSPSSRARSTCFPPFHDPLPSFHLPPSPWTLNPSPTPVITAPIPDISAHLVLAAFAIPFSRFLFR
ncbi:hypothetical protein NMY22_g11790 [Coprinellus aureogranulatus]|nr:hypothetical protein NMY22_g11790 [Coprinellus aureogranulatus]